MGYILSLVQWRIGLDNSRGYHRLASEASFPHRVASPIHTRTKEAIGEGAVYGAYN